jgi:hypothetical protein
MEIWFYGKTARGGFEVSHHKEGIARSGIAIEGVGHGLIQQRRGECSGAEK